MTKPFKQTPVCLSIETNVQDGANHERLFFSTTGTVYEKEGTTIFSYGEELEVGKVTNFVKVAAREVTIIRRGAVSMRQVFVSNQRTDGVYRSPYGALSLTTRTKDVDFRWDQRQSAGSLLLAYELDVQGQKTHFYKVKIHLEGAQP